MTKKPGLLDASNVTWSAVTSDTKWKYIIWYDPKTGAICDWKAPTDKDESND